MNYMEQVAKMLGVELGEEFYLLGFSYKHKITKNGTFFYHKENHKWYRTRSDLSDILTGEYKIIKNPILDEVEKEYLKGVIRPFKNMVVFIKKTCNYASCQWIEIAVEANKTIALPGFKKDEMYKGMKLEKEYTIEELDL